MEYDPFSFVLFLMNEFESSLASKRHLEGLRTRFALLLGELPLVRSFGDELIATGDQVDHVFDANSS